MTAARRAMRSMRFKLAAFHVLIVNAGLRSTTTLSSLNGLPGFGCRLEIARPALLATPSTTMPTSPQTQNELPFQKAHELERRIQWLEDTCDDLKRERLSMMKAIAALQRQQASILRTLIEHRRSLAVPPDQTSNN